MVQRTMLQSFTLYPHPFCFQTIDYGHKDEIVCKQVMGRCSYQLIDNNSPGQKIPLFIPSVPITDPGDHFEVPVNAVFSGAFDRSCCCPITASTGRYKTPTIYLV